MALGVSDLQSDSDLDSIRNSCDVNFRQDAKLLARICEEKNLNWNKT